VNLGNAYTYITEGIGEDILPENYDMSVLIILKK
jgi:cystathionine beta-synthase